MAAFGWFSRASSFFVAETTGARLIARHYSPVMFALAVCDRAQQPVSPHVTARQRDTDRFSRRKNKSSILKPHDYPMACRQVPFFRDYFSVRLVGPACE